MIIIKHIIQLIVWKAFIARAKLAREILLYYIGNEAIVY